MVDLAAAHVQRGAPVLHGGRAGTAADQAGAQVGAAHLGGEGLYAGFDLGIDVGAHQGAPDVRRVGRDAAVELRAELRRGGRGGNGLRLTLRGSRISLVVALPDQPRHQAGNFHGGLPGSRPTCLDTCSLRIMTPGRVAGKPGPAHGLTALAADHHAQAAPSGPCKAKGPRCRSPSGDALDPPGGGAFSPRPPPPRSRSGRRRPAWFARAGSWARSRRCVPPPRACRHSPACPAARPPWCPVGIRGRRRSG